ncbi:SDR family NAD(P)-dependent oxidoreductase, partial [Streptomyces scabiei]
TGGVGGMGPKFSEEFAKQGAKIVLIDMVEEKTKARAQELAQKYGIETLAVTCNTTNEDEVDAAVKAVIDKFNRIDVLVNTAAILRFSPLEDLRLDEWQAALNVNLTGYFLTSQRFGRVMI